MAALVDELAQPTAAVYHALSACLQVCRAWAENGSQISLADVAAQFPAWPAGVPLFDADALGIVFSELTDLGNDHKIRGFRQRLAEFQAITGSTQLQDIDATEPWYAKDVLHLLSALLLVYDPALCVVDLVATLVQSILDFGRDAIATIGFLLCARFLFRWGRGELEAETVWLVDIAGRAIQRANEYLLSEYVGELRLDQLVADLVA